MINSSEVPSFRIEKIHLNTKLLNFRPKDFIGKEYSFGVTVGSMLMLDFSKIFTHVSITINEDKKDFLLANFTVVYEYSAIHFDKLNLVEEGGAYTLPKEIEQELNQLSLNSTRGIVFSELRGTHLENAIMPILDDNIISLANVRLNPNQ